jgi:hypothetical protein
MVFVVPVERIELPTFGLQNRCSTAELNRRTKLQGSDRRLKDFVCSLPPATGVDGRARRQIPELIGKGYGVGRGGRREKCGNGPKIFRIGRPGTNSRGREFTVIRQGVFMPLSIPGEVPSGIHELSALGKVN